MIGCYLSGALPRPKKLIEKTRAFDRNRISKQELSTEFLQYSKQVIKFQESCGLTYIIDGMLEWQDLLRPFTEALTGITIGSLARWFNNNTFYRKPIVKGPIHRETKILENILHIEELPETQNWKVILPAPYTFAFLSEDNYYHDQIDLMFKIAEILNEEIKNLEKVGFNYIQLSDPALVYNVLSHTPKADTLAFVNDALKITLRGVSAKTCLQTFFGDFSKILPHVLDFPVDNLGIDLFATDLEKLRQYQFEKGIALGLINSRNSLVEEKTTVLNLAKDLLNSLYPSKIRDVYVCPISDLDFLPWERAKEKIMLLHRLCASLRVDYDE
jgi:5-methyltetrahydropteroyltriglutamate--homocysteine methyltransferase